VWELTHAVFAEASFRSGSSILLLSPRITHGKLGFSTIIDRFETTQSAAAARALRQIVLDDAATDLAWMEAGVDPCPAGDLDSRR
jgi:hypothetical protein